MKFYKSKGQRIRASDKHLVYHFSIGTLLFVFVAVVLLLNSKQLMRTDCLLRHLDYSLWYKRKSVDTVSAENVIFLFSYRYRLMISSFDGVCRRRYLPIQYQKSKEVQAVRKGLWYRQFLDCLFYAVYLVSVAFRVSLVLLGLRVFP